MLRLSGLSMALLLGVVNPAITFAQPPDHPALQAMMAAYDTNDDGTISTEELQTGRAADYATADSNSDGVLSLTELQAFETTKKATMDTSRFTSLDADSNGTLSTSEFLANVPTDRVGAETTLFGLADTDKSNSLSSAEFAALHSEQGRSWRAFAMLDANGDGSISKDEFVNATLPSGGGRAGKHR